MITGIENHSNNLLLSSLPGRLIGIALNNDQLTTKENNAGGLSDIDTT